METKVIPLKEILLELMTENEYNDLRTDIEAYLNGRFSPNDTKYVGIISMDVVVEVDK